MTERHAQDESGAFSRRNDVVSAPAIPAVRAVDLEDPHLAPFEEPNLELFALIEETQANVVPAALADARRLLREREERIAELEQQVTALRGELTGVHPSEAGEVVTVTPPAEMVTVKPPAEVVTLKPPALPEVVKLKLPELEGPPPSVTPETLQESEEYPMLKRVALSEVKPSETTEPPPSEAGVPSSRRRNQRLALELELEFTEDTHFYAGITQDLSEGGVFVATYRVLPVGTHLWLAFDLPDGARVRARGEVRWIREAHEGSLRPGMGVAFLELDAEALLAISKFCRARAPLYFEF